METMNNTTINMPVTNKEVEKRKDIRDNLDFFKELVE
jgi:hypothetical protein